ncbi:hypothetical protein AgCh_022498 [Apium graveolens]
MDKRRNGGNGGAYCQNSETDGDWYTNGRANNPPQNQDRDKESENQGGKIVNTKNTEQTGAKAGALKDDGTRSGNNQTFPIHKGVTIIDNKKRRTGDDLDIMMDEVFWRQRCKQLWLREGDCNSKFFHAATKARCKMNKIDILKNENGLEVGWGTGMEETMIGYFLNLFAATDTEFTSMISTVDSRVNSLQNSSMLAPVHHKEVKVALFGMHPDKSPGLDANGDTAVEILNVLQVYERASGQKINSSKLSVIFSCNTVRDIRESVCNTLGFQEADESMTYLEGGMGFRKLHDFNVALLGKQGWRLITNQESMVRKVYKSRYYPEGDFLSAKLGSNPSYVWRSVLESQNLLKVGASKRVGNGSTTDITKDPWLSCDIDPYIHTDHDAVKGQMVSFLMSTTNDYWDVDLTGIVKINTSVALFEESNSYSHAMVARNHKGTLLEAKSSCKNGRIHPELAESIGIREALSWIKDQRVVGGISGNIKIKELTNYQIGQMEQKIGQDLVVHWESKKGKRADIEPFVSIFCYALAMFDHLVKNFESVG